jgi:hypothetical protein
MDFGDNEDEVTLEKIEGFEQLVGKHQAIVASSSYWGEQSFPAANVRLIARHGSVPLFFWSPWDRPYKEGRGPDKYSLTSIIAGAHDTYIDRWADGAREFGGPMIVSFANEMNGAWFPWSGTLLRRREARARRGLPRSGDVQGRVASRGGPYACARSDECEMGAAPHGLLDAERGVEPRRAILPGADYVDWLGFSLYGAQFPSDDHYPDFVSCFDWPYTELAQIDPRNRSCSASGRRRISRQGRQGRVDSRRLPHDGRHREISAPQGRRLLARALAKQRGRRR